MGLLARQSHPDGPDRRPVRRRTDARGRGAGSRSLYGVGLVPTTGVDAVALGVPVMLSVGVGDAVEEVGCGVVAAGDGVALAAPVGPFPVSGLPPPGAGVEVGVAGDAVGVGVVLGCEVTGSPVTIVRIWFS